ncbi:MAG: SMP-30/gluconolactonase/LRE family protein, partial [Verrucomicrobiota bacterium]|nr:SMP-30/gluconolactonase/LRE family protein [Verrucomicrobiota bacterium]
MTTPITKAIGKQISQWGEGPIWWDNFLFYVDIAGNKLLRLKPETGEESIWDVGERIGTIVPCKNDDEVIYAGDTGYVRFNLKTGIKAALADPEASMRGKNRFNDGKCDP